MAVVLHFQIKSVLVDIFIPFNKFLGAFHVTILEPDRDFGASTARETNDTLVVFFHDFMVDTRFVVFTINFSFSCQTTEVFKALIVHGEQRNVVPNFIISRIAI